MAAIDILVLGVIGYAAIAFLKGRGRWAGIGVEK